MFHICEPRGLIRKARTKRRTTRTYKKVSELTHVMSKSASVSLLKGIRTFKKRIPLKALEDAFKTGNLANIMSVIPWDHLPTDLDPAFSKMHDAWAKAADFSVKALPKNVHPELRFDTSNPALARYLRKRTGSLIMDINVGTQRSIQRVIHHAYDVSQTSADLVPKIVERLVLDPIGLDPRRAQALQKFSESYRPGGLRYGTGAENERISTDRMKDRLFEARAMTIARTEMRYATNHGQLEIWKDAANRGFVDRQTAKKVWIVDGAPCDICEPMDGVAVGIDDQWVLPDGSMAEIPTDSHPNCMCGMELDFGDGTTADEGDLD